jgi:uncharacterized protein YecE (DUF72 family)
MSARFRVGTSGWSYDHWREVFYPHKLPARKRLAFYSSRFDTVEVNASFHRLPSEETFRTWREAVPREFKFAVKASRYLTHVKRLADPEEPLKTLLGRARVLGSKLGPVLFQLPPRWRANPERLAGLLRLLPASRRFVFEFRDPSWFNEDVRDLLAHRGAGFCIFHMVGQRCPLWVTAPFVYIRFHGTSGKYGGSYPPRVLAMWAERVRGWIQEGRDVYAYFNNDIGGHAVRNGRDLVKRLEGALDAKKD